MMKVTLNLLMLVLLVIGVGGTASAATYFTGNLASAQEVPPNGSTATGFGRVTLNDAETQITSTFYWSGLTGNATAGHIHGSAGPGANAPVIFNMVPAAAVSGSVVGTTFAVTPTQVADLKAGRWYFNIHTAANPGGEIRGQITVDAPYLANMTPRQENPAVNSTTANGFGAVSVNEATNQALVTMTWAGLSGNTTAAHYHSGRSGVNGPVVCNFSLTAQPPAGTLTDFLCTFSPAQITSLKQGQLYLNVHTAANPGGEIRGQIQRRRSTVLDFDGDSKTDYTVVRNNNPSTGLINWYILNSATNSFSSTQWGQSSDFNNQRMLGGDYDGDGKDDITVWRAAAEANFFILQSSNNTLRVDQFGSTGDDARMVYDYDGDGRTDPAVWRSSTGFLYYRPSANNPPGSFVGVSFGQSGDFPNPGDFDGDGRGDICVQRSTQFLCQNTTTGFKVFNWGLGSDFGVPGDYDGDGKVDINVVRTIGANRVWFPLRSLDGQFQQTSWGISTAARTQGDYDGDGKTDIAVWQDSGGGTRTFYVLPSNGNPFFSQQWGISTDIPVNAYNVR